MDQDQDDFVFETFRLSRRKRSLVLGATPLSLGTRAFDLLLVLVERAGTVVSKRELMDLVWPGLAIEESNLHVQIAAVRKVLGRQDFIRNVPGRGYCFAADVARPAEMPAEPPPPADNLPISPGRLIGRDEEQGEVRTLLAANRIVTVTGPSGTGKTHLALALAHDVRRQFPGGARLIDFAPLTDHGLIEGQLLAAMGLRLGEGGNVIDAVAAALAKQPALLLLDNCEHLLEPAAALADMLMRRCGEIRILATSQEPLRIPGETAFRLDPLALPPPHVARPEELRAYGAVELFLLRVEAADRHFRFGLDNCGVVAAICRDLDGIPLALEMAAARVPSLGLEGLKDRLGERLRVLSSSLRNVETRHRTLRATVSFSYDLLEPEDRAVFRRLGVFAGGFTAAAAVGVLAAPGADEWAVVEALARLVDKSLVVVGAEERPRYRLLETLRLFALEQMEAHAERNEMALRHARYFDGLLCGAYDTWESVSDSTWLAGVAAEIGNLRAAADFALPKSEFSALSLSLVGAGAMLWDRLSLVAEGRRYLDRAEAALSAATPPAVAARLHNEIGGFWFSSDRKRALAALERAATLYRALGQRARLGTVLTLQGSLHIFLGAAARAELVLQEARDCLRGSSNRKSIFNNFNNLGILAANNGSIAGAQAFFEQALQVATELGAPDREATVLMNLAEIEFMLGDVEAAVWRARGAIELLRTMTQDKELACVLINMSAYLLILERLPEAEQAIRQAFLLVRGLGGLVLRTCLQHLAMLAACVGRPKDALRLHGFVTAGYRAAGETREYTDQSVHDRLVTRLAKLPATERASLEEEGAGWIEAEAIAYAEQFLSALIKNPERQATLH